MDYWYLTPPLIIFHVVHFIDSLSFRIHILSFPNLFSGFCDNFNICAIATTDSVVWSNFNTCLGLSVENSCDKVFLLYSSYNL